MTNSSQSKVSVLVIGGGFGGVRAARQLCRHSELDVTLISNLSTFAYYPQIYRTATGGARSQSALPLSDIFGGTGVRVVQDVIVSIDPASSTVTSIDGKTSYHYDELVMALGSVTNYFGIQGLKEFSYDIKSIEGSEKFKRHLHEQLISENRPDLNYVVVGGGPTGIELAASLGDYLRRITALHNVPMRDYKIELVEAAPRLLPRSPESVSKKVTRKLEQLGVTVITGAAVQAETADALQLKGQSIATRTVVWTAGTSTNPFYFSNGQHFQLARNGRVMVSQYLEAKDHVYVIGDNADTPFAGMAQTAIRDADFVAEDIARVHEGKARMPYKPARPVSVIPVGHHWAVAEWHGLQIYGMPAYTLRRLADLIGYADVEPWRHAIGDWLAESRKEDNCERCKPTPESPTTSPSIDKQTNS